ncbi:hypothetical protein L7F22_059406 [Adiantum nelumboides]|nr:hypothetical protein [Adiantum nelumboides]
MLRDGLPSKLPPSRAEDHRIELIPGAEPPSQFPYRLSKALEGDLETQITDLLRAGFIRPSSSPFAAPVLFVMKKDKSARLCVDYREVDPNVESEDFENMEGGGIVSELANAIPGIDEAMSFAEMLKLVQTMDYSVIVFDTAPTGHTLRLLQFPSTLEKGLGKIMALKNRFGGLISQVSRMFGAEDEFGEDAIMGKLEGIQDVIEQVNKQFRDPELTTFVCVCIPEFLSLYETERLVQELARFEIDTHNVIINQILYEEGVESKLLRARMRMQQKYLDQFYELYEDFHITLLPLLPEEVRGVEPLKAFSKNLVTPFEYFPDNLELERKVNDIEELEAESKRLKGRLLEIEAEIERRKGKEVLL